MLGLSFCKRVPWPSADVRTPALSEEDDHELCGNGWGPGRASR